MDFSNFPLSGRYYGGSEKKYGILIGDAPYMLKLQKMTAFGKRFNHVSEFIGCHVFALLGFDAQETYLGSYQGEQVVACKDLSTQACSLYHSTMSGRVLWIKNKDLYQYTYEDIM